MVKRIAMLFLMFVGVAVFTNNAQAVVEFSEDWSGYTAGDSVNSTDWTERNVTGSSFAVADPGDGNLALYTEQGWSSTALGYIVTNTSWTRSSKVRVSWILWTNSGTNLAGQPGVRGLANNSGLFDATVSSPHGQYDLIQGCWGYLNWQSSGSAVSHATDRWFWTEGRRHWTHQLSATSKANLWLEGQENTTVGDPSRVLWDALFAADSRATAVHFRVTAGATDGASLEYSLDQGSSWVVAKIANGEEVITADTGLPDPINAFGGNWGGPNSDADLAVGFSSSIEPGVYIDNIVVESGVDVVPVEMSGFMLD